MSALREGGRDRTKTDVAVIRHVYLDVDQNGTAAVGNLLIPNYLVNSSPDKWQVIWSVEGFGNFRRVSVSSGFCWAFCRKPVAAVRVLGGAQPRLVLAGRYPDRSGPETVPR
jgi:hypothetical protein